MKYTQPAVAFLAIVTLAVSCGPSSEKPSTESRKDTAQRFERVKKETREATQEMKDYAYAQKAEFVAKMQGELDEINRELDRLAAKAEKSSDAAKAEAQPKLQSLRDQTANLRRQLDVARDATESTWEDVKTSVKKGYGELKDGFQQARQWVSEKIAPEPKDK